jgi:hypothetical protein
MEKTIIVNWDSYEELSRLFNQVKARYCELRRIATRTPSKKERNRRVFNACQEIWQTDISALYTGSYDAHPKYYVYAHLDTTRKIAAGVSAKTTFAALLGMSHWPFYVGKGIGDRCEELVRNETHRKVRERIHKLGKEITVVKIKENLTEAEALQYESKLIDIFGLVTNNGLLSNLDEGLLPNKRRERYMNSYLSLAKINTPLTERVHTSIA